MARFLGLLVWPWKTTFFLRFGEEIMALILWRHTERSPFPVEKQTSFKGASFSLVLFSTTGSKYTAHTARTGHKQRRNSSISPIPIPN